MKSVAKCVTPHAMAFARMSICASVMAIRAPFQINSGTRGSSAVRVLPSASGRARG